MEKDFQRWTAKRKVELLLQLIRGETKLVDACRAHDLKQSEVEGWMETFLQCGERGLKARSEDEQAVHERAARESRRARPGARRTKKIGRPHRETRESLLTVQGLMRAEGQAVSIAQLCRWFGVPRATFYYRPAPETARPPRIDEAVAKQIRAIIDAEPVAGLRMIVARVRRAAPTPVNRKKIHRIVKLNGWQVRQRPQGHRPRVPGWVSRATRPNERWAIDTTHLFTQQDGWCHLTALIDCCDRTIVGWRLARSGIAGVAAAALEDALRTRQISAASPGLLLRSDNGLVFGAKAFVAVARRYGLTQEYITPYTPEQNGMIERFFLTLKQECVWLHRFESRDHAFRVIADWLDRYDADRPHSALGYLTPKEYREKIAA